MSVTISTKCSRGGVAAIILASALGFCSVQRSLLSQEQEPPKPYLGFIVEQPTETSGVEIIDVHPESPIAAAGLKTKDILVSIDGATIATMTDLSNAMKGKAVGAKLKFVVKRDGKTISAEVMLGEAPSGAPAGGVPVEKVEAGNEDNTPAPLPDPDGGALATPSNAGPAKPYLGLTVVPHARGGAAISSIRKDSPAAKVGFPLGGVIIRVNESPVENPDDLIDYIAARDPGSTIELSYMHNDRLYRKQVKLSAIGGSISGPTTGEPEVVSPPAAPTPKDSPIPRDPPPKSERPIIDGINRAIRGGAPLGAAIGGGNVGMERQLDELRAVVAALEERIARLESELAAMKPGKPESVPTPPAPSP